MCICMSVCIHIAYIFVMCIMVLQFATFESFNFKLQSSDPVLQSNLLKKTLIFISVSFLLLLKK